LFASGAIIYAYVGGNPVNLVDSSGLNPLLTRIVLGGAARIGFPNAARMAAEAMGGGAIACIVTGYCSESSDDVGDDENAQEEDSGSCPVNRVTNPKHHKNSNSPEPNNVDDLFDKSVADNQGRRWVKDEDGVIHRFSKPSNGETHWNGSTSGVDPIRHESIPIEIRRLLK
jgi:hypothetical protein